MVIGMLLIPRREPSPRRRPPIASGAANASIVDAFTIDPMRRDVVQAGGPGTPLRGASGHQLTISRV